VVKWLDAIPCLYGVDTAQTQDASVPLSSSGRVASEPLETKDFIYEILYLNRRAKDEKWTWGVSSGGLTGLKAQPE
jgi:hypothetical protein